MRSINNLKDLNEIFPFDFYFYLNQAMGDMGLVVASPSFTFLESEHMKNHASVSDLKHRIALFETMQKPDEDFVTDEIFETNYIMKVNDEIPFYRLIPAIKKEQVDALYTISEKQTENGETLDALSLASELPVDSLTQISVQLFDENEEPLISKDKDMPKKCLTPFDERCVIMFSGSDGDWIFANKEFEWLKDYRAQIEKEIESEKSFEE